VPLTAALSAVLFLMLLGDRLDHHVKHRLLAHAEDALVAFDLVRRAHGLGGVVRQLDRGPAVGDSALQTRLNGASASSATRPRKSFVSIVPQPKDTFTRPLKRA
jgi:hypothetical protein